jgi:hypothetical protein
MAAGADFHIALHLRHARGCEMLWQDKPSRRDENGCNLLLGVYCWNGMTSSSRATEAPTLRVFADAISLAMELRALPQKSGRR